MEAGRDLDTLVAKEIFGLKVIWVDALNTFSPGPDGGLDNMVPEYVKIPVEDMGDGVVLFWTAECGTPTEYAPEIIKRYSVNIRDAWGIVEKVRPEFYLSLEVHEDHINACFCPHGEVFRSDGTHMYQGEADTAPLAICFAALEAVGYSLEEEKS